MSKPTITWGELVKGISRSVPTLDELIEQGWVSIRILEDKFNISRNLAMRVLADAKRKGLLETAMLDCFIPGAKRFVKVQLTRIKPGSGVTICQSVKQPAKPNGSARPKSAGQKKGSGRSN